MTPDNEPTLADDLRAENERLTRRLLAQSIRGKVLTAEEADKVCRRATESVEREVGSAAIDAARKEGA